MAKLEVSELLKVKEILHLYNPQSILWKLDAWGCYAEETIASVCADTALKHHKSNWKVLATIKNRAMAKIFLDDIFIDNIYRRLPD